ncbi:VOC family protein [Propionibacteriaceae bacterium G1746]|uniref:VOC family protein n=1 Tax=Aestuariimicrobium sp. G57 TaxID=3418485 RepID=UPI003C24E444
MTVNGAPNWVELTTTDLAKAKKFYGELLGWTFTDSGPDYGNYHIVSVGGKSVGGAMQIDRERMGPDATDTFVVYLDAPNAAEALERATAAGGTVLVPTMAVGDQGVMGFMVDAAGSAVGVWQPGTRVGYEAHDGHGAPVWFELFTRNFETAGQFYEEVFDWHIVPMAEQDGEIGYATNGGGAEAAAGLCNAGEWLPDGVQGYWRVYFQVDDADAAAEQAVAMGGHLLDGPTDSEFGRVATLVDDQGAGFQVLQPPVQ